jgi:hypothetical protein
MKEESEAEKKGRGMLTMILRFLMRSSLNGDSWSMAISVSSRTPKSRQAGRQGRNRRRKSARRFLVGREGMGRGS